MLCVLDYLKNVLKLTYNTQINVYYLVIPPSVFRYWPFKWMHCRFIKKSHHAQWVHDLHYWAIHCTIYYKVQHDTIPSWDLQQTAKKNVSHMKQFKEPCNGLLYQPICIQWAGPRSVRAHRSQTGWQPPGIIPCWTSVGVVLTALGVYPSCSAAQSVFPLLIVYRQSATQQAETVSRLLFLFGPWNLCGRRRKIILRLQLIFSPRFSSGKKTGLTLTAFCDINRVKSSPVWQFVTTQWGLSMVIQGTSLE